MRFPGRLPALAAAALLLAHGPAAGQDTPETKLLEFSGEGTELFRALLDDAGIKPLKDREFAELKRFDDVILINLGDYRLRRSRAPGPDDRFSHALFSGSVLIAADSFIRVSAPADRLLEIKGDRVACRNQESTLGNRSWCPFVVPVEPERERSINRLFKGLERVATNSPSYITLQGVGQDSTPVLAGFPHGSVSGRVILPDNAYFAVGGERTDPERARPYRFLMLADHSIFINQMLLEPGTDNLELTYRIIEFLQGPGKVRNRCAFFYNGEIIDHFDDFRQAYARQNQMPLPQINMGALQEFLVTQGNRLLDSVQNDDLLNRALTRMIGLPAIARFFLLVATVLACLFLIRRLWRSRKPSDIPPPPLVAGASTGPPGVFDRRQKELLRRDNVLEPVRDLVRDFFASIGIPGEPAKMPRVVIGDVVRKPDSLRAAIRDFWKIAFGPPQALTVRRWRELEPFFERLRVAHSDGKWRFVMPENAESSPSFASSAGSMA